MNFFLSCEGYAPGITFWNPLQQEFSEQLSGLKDTFYGAELTSIAIISILLPPEYFSEGGYKERSLFHRKECDADIRLRIDFHAFVHAKPEKRREIYKQHILDSLMTLKRKLSGDFDFDQLLADVSKSLDP